MIRKPNIHEVNAVLMTTVAIANGVNAAKAEQDAVRADTAAQVAKHVGYYDHLTIGAESTADHARDRRDIFLGLTALNLVLVAANGGLAISRRREQRAEGQDAGSAEQAVSTS